MYNTHEIICFECHSTLKKPRSGITVRADAMSGVQNADVMECPQCGYKILTGFGHEYGFTEDLEAEIYIDTIASLASRR